MVYASHEHLSEWRLDDNDPVYRLFVIPCASIQYPAKFRRIPSISVHGQVVHNCIDGHRIAFCDFLGCNTPQRHLTFWSVRPFGLPILFLTVTSTWSRRRICRALFRPFQHLCLTRILCIRIHGADGQRCHAHHSHCHHPLYLFHSLCRGT
jgi:hypothetical protein